MGGSNGPEDFSFAVDTLFSLGRYHERRLNNNWIIYIDDFAVRSGKWRAGCPMTDRDHAAHLRNASSQAQPSVAQVGGFPAYAPIFGAEAMSGSGGRSPSENPVPGPYGPLNEDDIPLSQLLSGAKSGAPAPKPAAAAPPAASKAPGDGFPATTPPAKAPTVPKSAPKPPAGAKPAAAPKAPGGGSDPKAVPKAKAPPVAPGPVPTVDNFDVVNFVGMQMEDDLPTLRSRFRRASLRAHPDKNPCLLYTSPSPRDS